MAAHDARVHAAASPESMAEALLEAMSEAVYVVDRGRKITYWNAAAAELTGFSASEVVGRSAGCIEDGFNAAHQADGGIGRGAGNLGDMHRAGGAIDANNVGKGTAGVDADPQVVASRRHLVFRLELPGHRQSMGVDRQPSLRPFSDAPIGNSDGLATG